MSTSHVETDVEQLVTNQRPGLVRALAMTCGSSADAEDAVQEAFTKLWAVLASGVTIDAPRAWLLTVSLNRVRSMARRRRTQRRYLREIETIAPTGGASSVDALDLRNALARLPRRQREAAVLYYFLDLPVGEIAVAMSTSEGMVKNALFRARQSLASSLRDAEEDGRGQ